MRASLMRASSWWVADGRPRQARLTPRQGAMAGLAKAGWQAGRASAPTLASDPGWAATLGEGQGWLAGHHRQAPRQGLVTHQVEAGLARLPTHGQVAGQVVASDQAGGQGR